jgi:hypothetical protein
VKAREAASAGGVRAMARSPRREAASGRGPAIRFSSLGAERLQTMLDAGREARDCMRVLAKTGHNIVGELIPAASRFYQWDHYPKGDVFDPASHAQYYYHAHPEKDRPAEHGHFHTFLRPGGMPKGVKPAPLADYVPPADPNAALSHLVGISMDAYGAPTSLFTTNRWVTDETWYRAEDVVRMLDFFAVDLAHPSWPVNRWIGALVALFRPQIEHLVKQRDAAIAAATRRSRGNVYENRALAILSAMAIDIDQQIAAIEAALERAR